MKIQKETKNKKKLIIITLLILALAGVVFSYFYFTILRNDTPQSNPNDSLSKGTHESDREQSNDLQENPENKNQAPNTDHPNTPSVHDDSNKKLVEMVASTDQSGETVYIRGGVNYPVVGGTCYAQLTGPSGQSIRKDSVVLQNPASADCKTIAMPINELSPGKWLVKLFYASNDYEGVSSEVSFTL